jgi:hypothetical protein
MLAQITWFGLLRPSLTTLILRRRALIGRDLIAVDGTRLKAVNSGQCNFTKGKLATAMARVMSVLPDT